MLKNPKISRRNTLKLIGASALVTSSAYRSYAQSEQTLRVAIAPYLPTQTDTERAWRPMFEYLASALGRTLEFAVAADFAAPAISLGSGHSDLIMTGAWGTVLAIVKANGTPLSAAKTHGTIYSKSCIIGRTGVDFSDFPASGKGMRIALGGSGGLSTWMWPQYYFRDRNIDPRSYFQYTEGVGNPAIVVSVVEGQTDLGCTWDTLLEQMEAAGTIEKGSYQVVASSEPLPAGGLVASPEFDRSLHSKIRSVLATITPEKAKELGMPDPYDGWQDSELATYDPIVAMGRSLKLLDS